MSRPREVIVVIIIELFFGILGITTGYTLLSQPTGTSMGLEFVLDYIPFNDLTLLGAWFFSVYGILPAVLAFGLWMRSWWAWNIALILAGIEIIWIVVQFILFYQIGFSIWQPIIAGLALLTIYLLYLPRVKSYFRSKS